MALNFYFQHVSSTAILGVRNKVSGLCLVAELASGRRQSQLGLVKQKYALRLDVPPRYSNAKGAHKKADSKPCGERTISVP